MHKNPVIIFEGVETSGKSTNIQNVSNFLKKIRRKYIKIREPGGSKNSEKIRKLILNKRSTLNKKTDLLLMLASRSENIDKIIKKNYKKKIILIDRFTDSTVAYQHFGMKIDIKIIKALNNFIIGKFKPNVIFLSVVNLKNLKSRLNKRLKLNRYDKFKYNFYKNVQKGYYKMSKNNGNYIIIDSNKKSISELKKVIINKLEKIT